MDYNNYAQFRLLVIEDEDYTRAIIKRLLRQIGFESIAEASSGKEGYAETARVKPHLILCDVHMANGDGLAFLKMLRNFKIEAIAKTPVIFLTADSQRDTILFAKQHGVSGYLVKPVSLNDLKARVDAALGMG